MKGAEIGLRITNKLIIISVVLIFFLSFSILPVSAIFKYDLPYKQYIANSTHNASAWSCYIQANNNTYSGGAFSYSDTIIDKNNEGQFLTGLYNDIVIAEQVGQYYYNLTYDISKSSFKDDLSVVPAMATVGFHCNIFFDKNLTTEQLFSTVYCTIYSGDVIYADVEIPLTYSATGYTLDVSFNNYKESIDLSTAKMEINVVATENNTINEVETVIISDSYLYVNEYTGKVPVTQGEQEIINRLDSVLVMDENTTAEVTGTQNKLTNSENALDSAGAALENVNKPNVDNLIPSYDDAIANNYDAAMVGDLFSSIFGNATLIIMFSILAPLMITSYILFGKRG